MIPVAYTVSPPQQQKLEVDPSKIDITATPGAASVTTPMRVRNGSEGSLAWRVESTSPWLSFQPSSGTSTGETDDLTVRVDLSHLQPGLNRGVITVKGQGTQMTQVSVPVTGTLG